jgi:hypothetical protein
MVRFLLNSNCLLGLESALVGSSRDILNSETALVSEVHSGSGQSLLIKPNRSGRCPVVLIPTGCTLVELIYSHSVPQASWYRHYPLVDHVKA